MQTRTTRLAAALAAGTLVFAACGSDSDEATDTTEAAEAADTAAADDTATTDAADGAAGDTCANTIDDGVLTLATGEPAFEPWVVDNAPETGEGFEAAVAMAVAAEMGYEGDAVTWVRSGFDEAIQPGAKDFDLNIQQFSITPERDETVDFSLPYYEGNQALVALDGSAAEGASIADLKGLQLGAQSGTTSLTFITDVIQPDSDPLVYSDNTAVKASARSQSDRCRCVRPPNRPVRLGGRNRGLERDRPVHPGDRRPGRRTRLHPRERQSSEAVRRRSHHRTGRLRRARRDHRHVARDRRRRADHPRRVSAAT